MNAQQTVDIQLIKHAEESSKAWRAKRDRADANASAWSIKALEYFDAAFPAGTLVLVTPVYSGGGYTKAFVVGRDGQSVYVAYGKRHEAVHYSRVRHAE